MFKNDMTIQYGQRRKKGLRRLVKYRLRQAVSALLALSLVTGGTNLQVLSAYADELSAIEVSEEIPEESLEDSSSEDQLAENASNEEAAEENGSAENSGQADTASDTENTEGSDLSEENTSAESGSADSGTETGTEADPAGSENGDAVENAPAAENTDADSRESADTGSESDPAEASDTTAAEGNAENPENHASSENTDSENDTVTSAEENAPGESISGDSTEDNAAGEENTADLSAGSLAEQEEQTVETDAESGEVNEASGTGDDSQSENAASADGSPGVSVSENGGSASGSAGTDSTSAGGSISGEILAETVSETETVIPAEEEIPEEEIQNPADTALALSDDFHLYQSIRAEIIGGETSDVYTEEESEPEIRIIGRLPEGAYAVAYREDTDESIGFDDNQFTLESYDITVYDETGTSYDVLPEEPLLVEVITSQIRKAEELDASLFTWYQSEKDAAPEGITRADRALSKDTFFTETAEGDVLDLNDLINTALEAEAAAEITDWEALGYAVVSRDINKKKPAATWSDYYEEDKEPGDDLGLFGAISEQASVTVSKIEKSLDKIHLDNHAYHFEYTGFGIYTVTTDDARLQPLTEQKLEAEIYTSSDYTTRTEEDTVITLSGMLPTEGTVRAYPVELDVADGIVLAAYDISIFRADGTLYEPKDENEILVEIDNPKLREALAEDRRFGVLHITEGTDLHTSEIIPIENALTEEETAEKNAEILSAAEEEYRVSSNATISRKEKEETEKLVSEFSESELFTAESLEAPAAVLRGRKLVKSALGSVVSGSLKAQNAAPLALDNTLADDNGNKRGSIPAASGVIDIEARFRGHEKMEDLPPSVSDALDQAVFVREAPLSFYAKQFSVYAIVETVLQKTITASDGLSYRITVSYDSRAGLPADAKIRAEEISTDDADALRGYMQDTADTLGVELSSMTYTKLFDISIMDSAGTEYQPDENVSVTIELLDEEAEGVESLRVVHFDEANGPVELDASTESTSESAASVTFDTDGFSAFSLTDFSLTSRIINAIFGERRLYENDDIILTGRMPLLGTVEATPVEVNLENEEVLVAYDIKIYANSIMKLLGITWQPSGDAIKVTVKSDVLGDVNDSISVYHMADEDSEAELVSENLPVEESSVTFDAESFSVYALSPETRHRTYRFFTLDENGQYVEYKFYTDTGATTYTQVIKNGESLVVPQLPSIHGSSTSTFAGWYEGSGNVESQPIDPAEIELAPNEFDFDNIPEITEDGTVCLFARFADFIYVVFHDQYNGTARSFPVAMTRRGEKNDGTATVQINDFSVAYDDDTDEHAAPSMAFHGWSYTPITTPGSAIDDYGDPVSAIATDTIEISKTTDLYPIFTPIHWLNYYSGPTGSGATYIPSAYYYDGEGPTSLSVPVRSGYTFDGWYTGTVTETDNGDGTVTSTVNYNVRVSDAQGALVNMSDEENGVSVSDSRLNLSKNATIYAKWAEASVNYTVVIWRQKSTDAANLPDAEKTYDYAESIVRSATTGVTVSVGNAEKGYSGTGEYVGFTYDRCDDSKAVEGDGSTVLNVYYDRNVHTLTFTIYNNDYTRVNNPEHTRSDIFGRNNYYGQYVQLTYFEEYGSWMYTDGNYYYYYSGNYYARGKVTIASITSLYGSSIKDYFPIVGTDGTNYNGYRWEDHNSPKVYAFVLSTIETMPDADVTFNGSSGGTNKTIYYYVEVSESEGERTFNGRYYRLYKTVNHNYGFITYNEEYHPISGYTRDYSHASPAFEYSDSRGYAADIGSGGTNYLYYDRENFEISFLDSHTNKFAFVGGTDPDNQLSITSVAYSDAIKNNVPADPTPVQIAGGIVNKRDGYSFTGWYTDPACSTRVFFEDNEEYQNYTRSKVLYSTMPAYNLRFYAGWETIWYKVVINPNYGWLNDSSGTGSTWFWEPYNGDPIEEYTWVKRDYVEAPNGTYFYHYDDRTEHGWGDEWTSAEDADQQRYAYYTTNQSDATDQSKTFKYAENAYRYAGWYEIDPETGEETLYNFGEPITHDTYLILHWKKIGTYHVRYNATVIQDGETISGTIDDGDSNETIFVELDGDHYADNAQVVIGRTVKAPAGYNFVGWTIRGDNSGKVYNPGDVFEFQSRYAIAMAEGDTIFLDPVYSRISTAKIIYDANGGTISDDLDFGGPAEETSIEPNTSVDTATGKATIENLVNNSEIRLSSGQGFTMANADLVGWSESKSFHDSETDKFFALGKDDGTGNIPTYYVDTKEPVTLYAVWKVKVYYHLNESTVNASFGDEWNPDIYHKEADDLYSQTIYINNPVDKPESDPVYINEDNPEHLFFRYWGTKRYAETEVQEYDFSQPVTGELHLFAYWAGPIKVPVHAVDSSEETIVNKDAQWLTMPSGTFIEVIGRDVSLTEEGAAVYAENVDEGYTFAFAAVKKRTDDIQTISEDKAITALYYNTSEKKVYVRYKDTTRADEPLADTDEVYLVYYKDPLTLSIGYKVLNTTGALTDAEMSRAGYPDIASAGTYIVDEVIDRPLYWANQESYKYYAYAIGSPGATNSSQLHLITDSSSSDSNLPSLRIRNTWRGYQYSTDDGIMWTNCGYDGSVQLYVIYFETDTKPSIVTITERTIGAAADMEEEFEYVVVVTETTRTTTITQQQYRWNSNWYNDGQPTTSIETEDPVVVSNNESSPYKLSDGEDQSITLFYTTTEGIETYSSQWTSWGITYRYRYITSTETSQTITVIQRSKTGFGTSNEGVVEDTPIGTSTQPYTWTYTTTETSENPVVTYTNIHTPLEVQVHVALINGESVTLDDNERSSSFSISVPVNMPPGDTNTKTFLNEISADDLFIGSNEYGFAGVAYGTSGDSQGDVVTVAGTNAVSITYAQMYPSDESRNNIYELTLNDNSNVIGQLGDYKIYYLYYPLPKVQYVKETAGGNLTKITDDGDHPVNSGREITLNGVTVTQNQMLNVGPSVFTITQDTTGTATNNYFNMPLILDDTTADPVAENYLRYSKIGAVTGGTSGADELQTSEAKVMMLKVDGRQVKWSFDGSEWNTFTNTPIVYAIYKETGYDLRITKKVTGEAADPTKEFTLTINSSAIIESSYSVTGTGYQTISAIPATSTTAGSITLTVKDGSDITISGLGKGSYTVSESVGAVLTAKVIKNGEEEAVTVHDNALDIVLDNNTELDLFNEMKPVAPTGYTSKKRAFGRLLLMSLVLGSMAALPVWYRKRRNGGGDDEM